MYLLYTPSRVSKNPRRPMYYIIVIIYYTYYTYYNALTYIYDFCPDLFTYIYVYNII